MDILDRLETRLSWYDFANKDWSHEQPTTDEIAKRYIPQEHIVQMLYECHRALGESIDQALTKTLEAASGTK